MNTDTTEDARRRGISRRACRRRRGRRRRGGRVRGRPLERGLDRRAGDPAGGVRLPRRAPGRASSPRPRTGCTSRRSTSSPTTATSSSSCCRQWTDAAERMTAGQTGRAGGAGRGRVQPAARRHRRGDRTPSGRAHDHLRVRADAVPHRGRQGPVRARGRQPAALRTLPHFPADNLDPARSYGDLCIQACADDPQVAVHAIRNLARIGFGTVVGALVAAGLRPHLDHLDQPVDAAEPVRVQGRHQEHQGRGDDGRRGARLGRRRRRRQGRMAGRWLLPHRPALQHDHRGVGPAAARRPGGLRRPHQGLRRTPLGRRASSPSPTSTCPAANDLR